MTNFLCWFPVIVMGLLAIAGFTIPGMFLFFLIQIFNKNSNFVFSLGNALYVEKLIRLRIAKILLKENFMTKTKY